MMQFDKNVLGRKAKEIGYVRDTFEKVSRLADVLRFFENDDVLGKSLALKGGTAINLTIFDLPRLSVDIDLDFSQNVDRETMTEQRKIITERIQKYMKANGYALSEKSKTYHALDSFVFEYQNAGGMKDNIKIEINYMLRVHILPVAKREVKLSWLDEDLSVLSVAPIEIFASKITALLNRTAPRDLYDIYNMLEFGLFDESEEALLRKCVVFYSCIGSESVHEEFVFENINKMSQNQIKTDLLPVLRFSAYFDLSHARERVIGYLKELLTLDENEIKFMSSFDKGDYQPELLFEGEKLENIKSHPMAIWKCRKSKATL